MLAALVLGACADQRKLREAELAELAQWLPGAYDNTAQNAEDLRSGRKEHEALAIVVTPIYAPFISEHVFYSQEMAADDPRRVLGQRVLAFRVDDDDRIVQSVMSLAEPARWRDGHLNPDLFKALMARDIGSAAGCDMYWKKEPTKFVAENDKSRCRITSRVTGGPVTVEARAELTPSELAMSDRSYDPSGKLVYGHSDEPFYRFRKRTAN